MKPPEVPNMTNSQSLRAALLAAALIGLAPGASAQQVHRWVDSSGRVHYSDLPPPPDARKVEERLIRSSQGAAEAMSFATRKANENFPVTLYVTDNCGPCDSARQYLNGRKIPFAETRVSTPEQVAELSRVTGDEAPKVPVMTVGSKPYKGWEQGAWNAALDAAGYPAAKR